jgi:peroxiredoxin Q/BCP
LKAYQADIAKVELSDAAVLAISVDSVEANARFAKQIGATFPLLSDSTKQVSQAYGVLDPLFQWANRTTFVVDKEGIIRWVDAGAAAINPAGAVSACARMKSPGN